MTKKLFYEDSYLKKFEAEVLECIPKKNGYEIVLDATAFFPEGGGQYADTGKFRFEDQECRVLDVQEKGDTIFHKTDRPIEPGTLVVGELDWGLRFMKMQQHSGEHIVSGLVHGRFGYDNVGFHLGTSDCTMDFNGEITWEELKEIERQANQVVFDNLPVQVTYPSKDELRTLVYRSKIEIEGQVRIVTVPGVDVCACCAPHVARTGEIGQIKLVNAARYKGGVRVTMLCGGRALDDYNRKLESAKKISSLLCVKEDEIAGAVEHLKEEISETKIRIAQLEKELLECRAAKLADDPVFVCVTDENLNGEAPRILMNEILERNVQTCAVLIPNEKGCRYCIGSRAVNLSLIVKEWNQMFCGKGGGKPEMIQGSLSAGTKEEWRMWLDQKVRSL